MYADVLILGAGPAGFHAAKAARKFKSGIVLAGAEPYLPYWRPRLSEIVCTGSQVESIRMSGRDWYEKNGIECRTSQKAVSIDSAGKTVRWEDGSSTEYGSLILSCGAQATVPPLTLAEKVYTLRSYADAVEIHRQCINRKKAFLVGGGILGLETAFALIQAGCCVTVSVHSYPLSHQLDREGGLFLKTLLEKEGIVVCCGDPANFQAEINGACVIAATGVRPSLDLAEGCGIQTDRGIVVDEKMRTSVPGIYACGDVAEYDGVVPGLMTIAVKQGETAGINAAGGNAAYRAITSATMMKVAGLSVFSIGNMNSSENTQIYRKTGDGNYAAAAVTEGRLTGAAFIGEIALGMKFKGWIESGREIGPVASFEEIESRVS